MRRAVVIGAGLGGLACAARLVTAGVDVTLLEAGRRAGGKCGGKHRDGFTIDFAPHLFSLASEGEIARVCRMVGEPVEFVVREPLVNIRIGHRSVPFPARPLAPRLQTIAAAARVVGTVGVNPTHVAGIARHFLALCRGAPDLAREDRDVTVREWVSRYTDDAGYHTLMNLFSLLTFVVPYDEGSAREQGRCFLRMTRGPGVGYPRGGCLGLTNAQLRGLRTCGADVRLRHRVDRIECDGGRVRAVWARGQRFEADAVFCNAGVRRTAELAGAGAVGADYLRYTRELSDSLAGIMIRYTLEEPVIPDRVLWSMPDLPAAETCERIRSGEMLGLGAGYYVTIPSNFDPDLAPPGKQVVVAGTLYTAKVENMEDGELMLLGMERRLERLYPGFAGAVRTREVAGVDVIAAASGRLDSGEAVGVAQTPTQSEAQRPSMRTPVDGLWVVGADTGSGAIGTELAASSGLEAAEDALSDAGLA